MKVSKFNDENITFESKLVKATVGLKDNRFPTVEQAKKEADHSFKELLRARRKL